MKLSIEQLPFGMGYRAIDYDEYDGAEDAGPQLVGEGKTEEEARADFWAQRIERDAERDAKAAAKNIGTMLGMLNDAFRR